MDENIISRLKKLGQLYKEGLLTQEEFEEQKRRILTGETHATEKSNQKETVKNPSPRTVPDNQHDTNPPTRPKDPKRRNKRIVVIAIIAIVIIAAAIAIPLSISHKREAERQQQMELARLDSIQREEARLEALRIEEARLDSIRQDSIAFEEKMRLLPEDLICSVRDEGGTSYHIRNNILEILEAKGFQKGKTELTYDGIDEISGGPVKGYRTKYERNVNGRKISLDYYSEKYAAAPNYKDDSFDFEFFDKKDLYDFINGIRKMEFYLESVEGSRKHYSCKYDISVGFYIDGNKIYMIDNEGL